MVNTTKTIRPTIYIEAGELCRKQRTGVAYWTEGLIRGLIERMPGTDFVLFHFSQPESDLRITGPNVRETVITKLSGKLFRLLYIIGCAPKLESLLGVSEIETIIFPDFYAWPLVSKSARVITFVPDTTFLDVPQFISPIYFRQLLRYGVKYSARVSDQMVVCSEFTRQSIHHHYGRKLSSTYVVYPGYEIPKNSTGSKEVYIPRKHILFIGTLDGRKNIANLIRGYMTLTANVRKEFPLVLAGGMGRTDAEITELITRHERDGVRAIGYVSESDRERLYRTASIFAYPVVYEGFGMPVIEAQAHGVPVLSTNNSSLPEATGGIAVYCDVSPQSIGEHLSDILKNPKERARLAVEGKRHAASFTWERGQELLYDIITQKNPSSPE